MNDSVKGPYVTMATLCEKVLEEKDGVVSIIRAVDRFTLTGAFPDPLPALDFTGQLFLMLKSGDVNGSHTIGISLLMPNGTEEHLQRQSVLFEGDDRGVNLRVNLKAKFEEPGLYWISVYFEDQVLTRVPLRLIVQRLSSSTALPTQ